MPRRNPPAAKNPDDFGAALSLAERYLSHDNPAAKVKSATLNMRLNIVRMATEFKREGRNISALSPEDWHDLLTAQGMHADVATSMVEEIASWGVDDLIE